jgi:integrase
MTATAAAALINLLGYLTGSLLYAMLLAMALGRQSLASSVGMRGLAGAGSEKADRLPLLTALLGLAWNLGAIAAHVLRHSCATLLLAEGKHAKVVADRLGHTSVAMTLDVYSHVTRRLEDEVAESFDRKFNKPNEKRRSDS